MTARPVPSPKPMSPGRSLILVAILLAAGCGPPPKPAPPSLVGAWTTSNPRYAGRALVVEDGGVLRFVQGGAGEHVGQITSIEAESVEASALRYSIEYVHGEGVPLSLRLELDPKQDVLQIDNVDGAVWSLERRR